MKEDNAAANRNIPIYLIPYDLFRMNLMQMNEIFNSYFFYIFTNIQSFSSNIIIVIVIMTATISLFKLNFKLLLVYYLCFEMSFS